MNGRAAKKLRKVAYGDKVSGQVNRIYYRNETTGAITADRGRRFYQHLKKLKPSDRQKFLEQHPH